SDQLVIAEYCRHVAGDQFFDRDVTLAAGAYHPHRRVQGNQHRRQIHVRIAVREIPPTVATLRTRTLEWVSNVSAMTGAACRTTAERSICASRTIAPMSSPPSGVVAIMVIGRPS